MKAPQKVTIADIKKTAEGKITPEGEKLIDAAFRIAKKAHAGQRRKTGEAFINHPLAVAFYVAYAGLGAKSISAALMHDTLEDSDITPEEITAATNKEVAGLVDGVTKLRHTHFVSEYDEELESIRKFIIAAAKDVRVLIIKLADRLHNAQTLSGLSPKRQNSYSKEIETIFVPLAEYIGIQSFKRDLENIAFKQLHPKRYKQIKSYLHQYHKDHEAFVRKYEQGLKRELNDHALLHFKLESRAKSIASIDKKIAKYIEEKKIKTEDDFWGIYDYYAMRIICENTKDCYTALGIVNNLWEPIEEEFDDYITKPKPNGYRSIHTTVYTPEDRIIEIQIRTKQMHYENEFGPASHIAYKLSGKRYAENTNMFDWISNLFHWQSSNSLSKKDFEIDIFKKNIFVLTPKQAVRELVKNATPVDFAYSIHTDIGNSCRGAKVNGKIVSLNTTLKTGDVVEIITEKTAKYPVKDWLKFVKSAHTKSHINRALREKEEESAIFDGEKKIGAVFKKNRRPVSALTGAVYSKLFKKYSVNTKEELFAKVGFNIVSAQSIYDSLYPSRIEKPKRVTFRSGIRRHVAIEGSEDSMYTFAKCCSPKPGDSIVAVTTLMKGIRVHTNNCEKLSQFEEDRHLHAEWI